MYVRHSAWLYATPDKAEGDKSKKPNVSRLQQMRDDLDDDEFNPEMPPVDAQYLADYFFEIGPTMGENPITSGELESWQRNTGIKFNAWECRTLMYLSKAFVSESQRATKLEARPPWADAPYVESPVELRIARISAALKF